MCIWAGVTDILFGHESASIMHRKRLLLGNPAIDAHRLCHTASVVWVLQGEEKEVVSGVER